MSNLSEKIKNLPPEKLDALLRQLRPKSAPTAAAAEAPATASRRPFRPAEDQNFSLVVKRPGLLESLAFRTRSRFSPDAADPESRLGPEEVEIEIFAASLNFRDVAVALGMYPKVPGLPMPQPGCDGAGIITAVGREVTRFKVGDEVMCLSEKSTFARYTAALQSQVLPKPPHMTFEQAASLPLAFITAYYGLTRLGKLYPEDRILIHSAAGGVGLAAVQIAQSVGAEIYATVGTQEKRDYLRSVGVEHVMDSRSLDFLQETMELTGGEGVDVILNSLSGDALTEGIKLLRPNGRFVELGKRDLVPGRVLDLQPFVRGLSFAVAFITPTNKAINSVIQELGQHFADGTLRPPVIERFPVSRLTETFRYMTQGKHIGKLVISMRSDPVMVEVG
ncbi:MAG: zinc-binding dehydrogenase [Pyrinomonadaceae bacterium]